MFVNLILTLNLICDILYPSSSNWKHIDGFSKSENVRPLAYSKLRPHGQPGRTPNADYIGWQFITALLIELKAQIL